MTTHQIDLSGPSEPVEVETYEDPARAALVALYLVLAGIALCAGPALVIAAWRWAL